MWEHEEPWDEDEWEAFLRESDRRTDRCMALFHEFMEKHPRPDDARPEALAAWKARVRAFVERKGWTPDDIALPFLWLEDAPSEDAEEDFAWLEDYEAAGNEGFEAASLEGFRQVPLYRDAYALVEAVIDWSDGLPGALKDSALVQFCAQVMQVPAEVAKGHAFGYERDGLGGNIACLKRGLGAANAALGLLRELRERPYLNGPTYRRLYEQLFEVRNAAGLRVQELRARFDLGTD